MDLINKMDTQKISQAINKVIGEMGIGMFPPKGVTLEVANKIIKGVMEEAKRRDMKVVVAVADAGGNPVAVQCMDDSYYVSYKIALDKAYTSVSIKMATKELAKLANPNGGSLYGIQFTDPRIVIFGGGEALEYGGRIVGGVGVSGGTAEQDTQLGEYAKKIFKEITSRGI